MRPKEVAWFERIIFGTLLLGVIKTYLAWDEIVSLALVPLVVGIQLAVSAMIVGLTLLVSRLRSNVAKWVLIALFSLGLPAFAKVTLDGLPTGSSFLSILQVAGQAVAFALLFTANSRRWLGSKPVSN